MDHYFIGKLLNPEDSKKLIGKQSYITRNLNVPITGKIINFNTKFTYLGYMDEQTMLKLQDKLNNVFEALTMKYKPQKCTYTGYGITGLRTTKKSIAALYNCPIVEQVIVPFIRSYTDDITGETAGFYPHVSLLRIDARDQSEVEKQSILNKTYLPDPNTFTIDSIDILKGTPKIRRSGPSSRYDDMEIKVINKYMLRGNNQ